MADITTIRITKSTHKEILKIMGQIQARTGEIPTPDDGLQELLNNYKKKSKKQIDYFKVSASLLTKSKMKSPDLLVKICV